MDFRSPSFLIVTIAMFAIAAFAVVQGIIPIAVVFALPVAVLPDSVFLLPAGLQYGMLIKQRST